MGKAVSALIATVLVTAIGTIGLIVTMTLVGPIFSSAKSTAAVNSAFQNLEALNVAAKGVASETQGSKRTISLSVSDGVYKTNSTYDWLYFEYEPEEALPLTGTKGNVEVERGLEFADYFNWYVDGSEATPTWKNMSGQWTVDDYKYSGTNGTSYYNVSGTLENWKFSAAISNVSGTTGGQVFVLPTNPESLVGFWQFDNDAGKVTYDYSGRQNTGNFSGSIIGNFEGALDGFQIDCGGVPTSSYVAGKIGQGIKMWATGGDGLACLYKSVGVKTVNYTVWFYGKGYVRAQLWNGTRVSRIVDVEAGCVADSDAWSSCNGGQPYQDWQLFKLITVNNTVASSSIYAYDGSGAVGEDQASYYDFFTDGPIWLSSEVAGNAATFDGVDDYVDAGNASNLDFGTNDFTIAVWAKANGGITGRGIVNKGGWGSTGYGIQEAYSPANRYFFVVKDSTGYKYVALPLYETWGWTHIVCIKTTNHMEVWVNGTYSNENNVAIGSLSNPTKKFEIGRSFNPYYFNGTIDEVMVFNRALTPGEITSLYETGVKKLSVSGTQSVTAKTNASIVLANPAGSTKFDDVKVWRDRNELTLFIPYENIDINGTLRAGKGEHRIEIRHMGVNTTSNRAIIQITAV